MNSPQNSNISNNRSYNLDQINMMCRGDQEQTAQMVKVFIDQVPKSIEIINKAFTENDIIAIKKEVHKIKPTAHFFGAMKLAENLILTETLLSKEFILTELEMKVHLINQLTNDVVEEMKNDFNIINE